MSELSESDVKDLLCDCADEANSAACPGCTKSARHLWTEKSGSEILAAVEAIVARHRAEAAREALLSAADEEPFNAQGVKQWLRDRAAQIGSEA